MIIPEILQPYVKMCYYVPDEKKHQEEVKKGHILFDDMQALKLYCLKHTYAINMPSLINANCKSCWGTGRAGRNVKTKKIEPCRKCLLKEFIKEINKLLKLVRYERQNSGTDR